MGISALLAAQILDASATGRSVLTGADASAIRTTLGLGTLATQSPTGTPSASTFLRGDFSWQTIDLSGYVPYTGATAAVNLGSNAFTASRATLATGAITTSTPAINVSQTWNNAATTFTGILSNVTDTASNAASLLLDLQVGGTSCFSIRKSGLLQHNSGGAAFPGGIFTGGSLGGGIASSTCSVGNNSGHIAVNSTGLYAFTTTANASTGTYDLILVRDAANTLAQRNSTNAQTFRVYGTYADASNYRRLFLSSTTAGAFTLGVEGAGTGASGNTLTVGPAIFKTNDNEIYGVVKNGTSGSDTSRLFIWADGRQQARFGYASGYDGLLLGNGSYGPMIWMGGATSSFPAIKRNGTALNFRLADDSADCDITAAHGTFSAGTDTTNNPILNLSQTWNNAATTFTGILANVTDTASNASSLLMDLQVSGSSRFRVQKDGRLIGNSWGITNDAGFTRIDDGSSGTRLALLSNSQFQLQSQTWFIDSSASSIDFSTAGTRSFVFSPTSNIFQLRRTTNAQVLQVYNTFTDASNYERAKIAWESSVLRIGTEKAGTGSARALELQTDGVTRLTVGTTGSSTFANRVMIDNAPSGGALGSPLLLVGGPAYTTTNQFYTIGFGFTNSFSNRPPIEIGFDETSSSANTLGDFIVATRNVTTNTAATVRVRIKADGTFGIEDGNNIEVGTTTGTKIGTATTQKIAFFDKTPVVQPTAVADATDAASVITQLNALLSRMRDLGLIAT